MRKHLILISLIISITKLFSIVIEPVTLEFINGKTITGSLVDFKDDHYYFSFENKLYIINKTVVSTLSYKERKIDDDKLLLVSFDRVLWSDYLGHMEIKKIDDLIFAPRVNQKTDIVFNGAMSNDSRYYLTYKAGESLKAFSTYSYIGLAFTITGYLFILTSDSEDLQDFGIGVATVGTILTIIAPSFVNKAGNYLKELSEYYNE